MVDGLRVPTAPAGHPDLMSAVAGGGMLTEWTESVPDLVWPESVKTYGRMRRDAKISAVLRAMFLPIIRATWAVDPEDVRSDEAVQLVAEDLGLPVLGDKDNPNESPKTGFSWADHVRLALLHLVYGYMPFEQWYELRGGRTHLAGVQERLPQTITEMDIGQDGQMQQVYQYTQDTPIPSQNLLWYVHEREGSNWAGTSLLRACYTPWVLKHETMRVHATSIRRFGMGVPNVIAPPGATAAQIAEAQRLASGMRAGDESGAGLPAGYEFRLTGLTGAAPDAIGFLEYCNQEITTSALAQVIELGHSSYGSKALGESFLDLFLLALQAAADLIGDTATFGSPTMPGLSKALTEYNFGEGEPAPKIVCTDVGDRHEITSTSLNLLIQAGAITPDPVLEAFIRNAWGLPERVEVNPPPPGTVPAPGPSLGPTAPDPGTPGGPSGLPPGLPGNTPGIPGTPGGTAARRGGRRHRRPFRAGPTRPHRPMTAVEAAAGLDPEGMAADLDNAAARLAGLWNGVLREQRTDLAGQVQAAVDAGDLTALGALRAPPAGGPDLLTAAMTDMAWTAARRACDEAAAQRVFIDPARLAVDEPRLAQLATARAALAAQQLERAASHRALAIASGPRQAGTVTVRATPGDDAAADVTVTLEGLSTAPLADQLEAAMTSAQNEGRTAAFTQADEDPDTPDAVYVATEILDANTCPPCEGIDGTEFASLDEATGAYANGGYVDCEGGLRCRGTYIATWPDVSVTAPGEGLPDPGEGGAEGEPADSLAKWMRPDGTWAPSRQALHDDIVDRLLEGYQPEDTEVVHFLGGGPASGKSSLATPGGGRAAVIDPDAIKAMLPEYQEMLAAGDSRAAAYVQEESSAVAAQARATAGDRGLSYVVDGTGDSSYAKMAGKVNAARAAGAARVEADYLTIDTDEAIRRATVRAAATGRVVPEPVIRAIHASVTDVFTEAASKGLFDEMRLWDNNGAGPVLIATATKAGGLRILDQAAYDRFLAKSPQGLKLIEEESAGRGLAPLPLAAQPGGEQPPGNRALDWANEDDVRTVVARFTTALNMAQAIAAGAVPRPDPSDPIKTAALMLADDPAAQRDAQELVDRADLEEPPRFGDPEFPFPFEFATVGWFPGLDNWPGRELTAGGPASVPPPPAAPETPPL